MTKSKCCGAECSYIDARYPLNRNNEGPTEHVKIGPIYCLKCGKSCADAKPEGTDEEFEVPDHPGRWICDYVWRDGEEYPPIKAESLRQVVDYILKLEGEAAEHTRWIFTNALKTADLIAQREEAAAREAWEEVVFRLNGYIVSKSKGIIPVIKREFDDYWKRKKSQGGVGV